MRSDLTPWMEDPNLLRGYLLGGSDRREAGSRERRLLADGDLFELVEAVESELLEDCVTASRPGGARRVATLPGHLSGEPAYGSRDPASLASGAPQRPKGKLIPSQPIAGHLRPSSALRGRCRDAHGPGRRRGGLSRITGHPGRRRAMAGNRMVCAVHRPLTPEQWRPDPSSRSTPSDPHASPATGRRHAAAPPSSDPATDPAELQLHGAVAVRELAPAFRDARPAPSVPRRAAPHAPVPAGTRRIEIQLPIQEVDDFPPYRATNPDAERRRLAAERPPGPPVATTARPSWTFRWTPHPPTGSIALEMKGSARTARPRPWEATRFDSGLLRSLPAVK